MAGSILQEAQNSTSSVVSTIAIALPSAVTAGSLLHVFAHNYSSSTTANGLSITDSQNNTYTVIGGANTSDQGETDSFMHAYAANAKAGATTVTMHTPSGSYVAVWVREIAGVATASPLLGGNIIWSSAATVTAYTTISATSGFLSALGAGDVLSLETGDVTALHAVSPLVADVAGWTYSGSVSHAANSSHEAISASGNTTAAYSWSGNGTENAAVMMAVFALSGPAPIVQPYTPIKFYSNGAIGANAFVTSAPGGGIVMKAYWSNATVQAANIVQTGAGHIKIYANGTVACNNTIILRNTPPSNNIITVANAKFALANNGTTANITLIAASGTTGNTMVLPWAANATTGTVTITANSGTILEYGSTVASASSNAGVALATGTSTNTLYTMNVTAAKNVSMWAAAILTNVGSVGTNTFSYVTSSGTSNTITGTAMTIPNGGAILAVCWSEAGHPSNRISAPAGNTTITMAKGTAFNVNSQFYTGNATSVTPVFTANISGTYMLFQALLAPTSS